jgi:hypothetical protein
MLQDVSDYKKKGKWRSRVLERRQQMRNINLT